jgi:hypothetical protein
MRPLKKVLQAVKYYYTVMSSLCAPLSAIAPKICGFRIAVMFFYEPLKTSRPSPSSLIATVATSLPLISPLMILSARPLPISREMSLLSGLKKSVQSFRVYEGLE